jgi:hypothetical protein
MISAKCHRSRCRLVPLIALLIAHQAGRPRQSVTVPGCSFQFGRTSTQHGTVLLTVTTDTGQQGQADLPIEVADKLKTELDRALLAARMHQIEMAIANRTMRIEADRPGRNRAKPEKLAAHRPDQDR